MFILTVNNVTGSQATQVSGTPAGGNLDEILGASVGFSPTGANGSPPPPLPPPPLAPPPREDSNRDGDDNE